MTETIRFTLDGREVEAGPGETIWQVAARQGIDDPAPLLLPRARLSRRRQLPGLHGRGRGRARAGRLVHPQAHGRHEGARPTRTAPSGARAWSSSCCWPTSRRAPTPTTRSSKFWQLGRPAGPGRQPLPAREHAPAPDRSHPAMAVQLDACIQCGLCVRACREVQVNDVIGMAYRGPRRQDRLRPGRPDGPEHLRRLRRVRPGLPDRGPHAGARARRPRAEGARAPTAASTASAPIAASAASSPIRSRTNGILYVDGRDGPANHNRLCVKGRFGFDYVHHPQRLTTPLIRKAGRAQGRRRPRSTRPTRWTHFREATLGRGPRPRPPPGLKRDPRPRRRPGAGRLRLGQGLERGGVPLPEARAHGLRQQQRRPLHAALPRLVGRRADGDDRLGRRDRPVRRVRATPT